MSDAVTNLDTTTTVKRDSGAAYRYFAVLTNPMEAVASMAQQGTWMIYLVLFALITGLMLATDVMLPATRMTIGFHWPALRLAMLAELGLAVPIGILARALVQAKFIQWCARMCGVGVRFGETLTLTAITTSAFVAQMVLCAVIARSVWASLLQNTSATPSISGRIGLSTLIAMHAPHVPAGSAIQALVQFANIGTIWQAVLVAVALGCIAGSKWKGATAALVGLLLSEIVIVVFTFGIASLI